MFRQFVSYSQYSLRKKIATYFEQIGKPQPLGRGHCHGLSILWLRRMAEGREHEFYADVTTIVNCPDDQLHQIRQTIERFFKKADKRQSPYKYPKMAQYEQADVDKLLKATRQTILDQTYLTRELNNLFHIHSLNGNMFCISHKNSYWIENGLSRHAIAVYIRGGDFYCYDANYVYGRAKCFHTAGELVREIKDCLFTRFNLKVPSYLPLKIKKVESSDLIVKQKPSPVLESAGTFRNALSYYSQYLPWPLRLFAPLPDASKKRTIEQCDDVHDNDHQAKKRKMSHS